MSGYRAKSLAKERKTHCTLTLDGETLIIQSPSLGQKLKLGEDSKAAGDLNDENEPTSPFAQVRCAARMVIAVTVQEGKPVFGPDDLRAVIDDEHFTELAKAAGEAFNGGAGADPVEDAKTF